MIQSCFRNRHSPEEGRGEEGQREEEWGGGGRGEEKRRREWRRGLNYSLPARVFGNRCSIRYRALFATFTDEELLERFAILQ